MREIELESHCAVQPRRDHVEGIFHERTVDRRAAPVARVNTYAGTEIRRDAVALRKDELEIDVADDVAERDAAKVDAIGSRGIHDAIEAPFEPIDRLLIESRVEVRQTEQEPYFRRDAAIVDA